MWVIDLSRLDEIESFAARAADELGGVDVLDNNAGMPKRRHVRELTPGVVDEVVALNLLSPLRLTMALLPAMLARDEGRIVNVSSIAGRTTAPFAGHYTGAKHALEALSDSLRIEVAGDGVKVVLIEPGGFKTGIWAEMERDVDRREADGSRYASAYRRSLRGQRLIEPLMGQPDGCADVIATALTTGAPRSRYLVGRDAQALLAAQRFTPTFIKDRAIRLGLGL